MRPNLTSMQLVHAVLDEVRERGPFRNAVKHLAHEVRELLNEPYVVDGAVGPLDDEHAPAVSCPECHGDRDGCPRCNHKGYVLAEAETHDDRLYSALEVADYQTSEAELVTAPLRKRITELARLVELAGAVEVGGEPTYEPVGWLPVVRDGDGDCWARDRGGWFCEQAEGGYPRLSWAYLREAHGPLTLVRPGYTTPMEADA